ncbi:MAG: class I SAM-dependent RNA methyltransferase, partial [Candidatus Zixiibacteriota bacterium]
MGGGSTDASFPLVAKTLFGLEEVLAAELEEIGAGEITILTRAVQFTGNTELMYRSNLALRTATRILKQIAVFSAPDSDSLYTGVASVDWSEHLDTNSTFAVDPIISHSAFDNSLFVAQRAKDAIVDQMRDRRSRRPSVNRENPDIRLSLYIHKNEATLSLDSSGAPLHKRGYRLDYGAAPLNEVLAAGIIKLTGWSCEVPLLDPMCGSGTLLIEAALQTAGIPPGLLRKDYGFMRWKDYDRRLFSSVREELGARRVKSPLVKIIGSDMDKSCIRQARSNAEQAGIAELIHFE